LAAGALGACGAGLGRRKYHAAPPATRSAITIPTKTGTMGGAFFVGMTASGGCKGSTLGVATALGTDGAAGRGFARVGFAGTGGTGRGAARGVAPGTGVAGTGLAAGGVPGTLVLTAGALTCGSAAGAGDGSLGATGDDPTTAPGTAGGGDAALLSAGGGVSTGGVGGVAAGGAAGFGLIKPGGAASSMGAPQYSQKPASKLSGPLQNRQTSPPAAPDDLRGGSSSSRAEIPGISKSSPSNLRAGEGEDGCVGLTDGLCRSRSRKSSGSSSATARLGRGPVATGWEGTGGAG